MSTCAEGRNSYTSSSTSQDWARRKPHVEDVEIAGVDLGQDSLGRPYLGGKILGKAQPHRAVRVQPEGPLPPLESYNGTGPGRQPR